MKISELIEEQEKPTVFKPFAYKTARDLGVRMGTTKQNEIILKLIEAKDWDSIEKMLDEEQGFEEKPEEKMITRACVNKAPLWLFEMFVDAGFDLSFHWAYIIDAVLSKNPFEIIKFFVDNGAPVKASVYANPLLHYVVRNYDDDYKTAQYLVDHGADVNDIDTSKGQPILTMLAKESHKMSDIEFLIKNNVNVNKKDGVGRTALFWACQRGYKDIVELLLKNKADPNLKDDYGWTALMTTAKEMSEDHPEIAQMLIDHGADINAKTTDGVDAEVIAMAHSPTIRKIIYNARKSKE